jgi:hypothetical protein
MNRDYNNSKIEKVIYFVGTEVERTPALGKKTLFVVDVQPVEDIRLRFIENKCEHIFFGANHSFNPGLNFPTDADEWQQWKTMIRHFLEMNILCSLDIPISHAEAFLEESLVEYENFIPQLRVPVPYIKQWNYNTMLKIDDRDFRATNPGVWCHSLHDLMDREKFTNWSQYTLDNPLE